jgi:hypothetical protein
LQTFPVKLSALLTLFNTKPISLLVAISIIFYWFLRLSLPRTFRHWPFPCAAT